MLEDWLFICLFVCLFVCLFSSIYSSKLKIFSFSFLLISVDRLIDLHPDELITTNTAPLLPPSLTPYLLSSSFPYFHLSSIFISFLHPSSLCPSSRSSVSPSLFLSSSLPSLPLLPSSLQTTVGFWAPALEPPPGPVQLVQAQW